MDPLTHGGHGSAQSPQLPRDQKREGGGESRHGSQLATGSLELAWVGEWDATLKNGNAQIQILPLKKNSPERNSAENGMGHCVWLEARPQMADDLRVRLAQLFWASLSPLHQQLLVRQQSKV